jgi:hypothetical protein
VHPRSEKVVYNPLGFILKHLAPPGSWYTQCERPDVGARKWGPEVESYISPSGIMQKIVYRSVHRDSAMVNEHSAYMDSAENRRELRLEAQKKIVVHSTSRVTV